MNVNPWERLHRIVQDRIGHLGATRDELHAAGGPAPATIRGLKNRTGKVTVKQRDMLLELDAVLGWDSGTSRDLVDVDRSDYMKDVLEDEAEALVTAEFPDWVIAAGAPRLSKAEREIRTFATQVQARLRTMDDDTRRDAIAQAGRILGIW